MFPLVVRLLTASRPSAVRGFVGPVNVDTVNAVLAGWLRPHVREERLERIQPSIAYTNAPRAVSVIAITALVIATLLHGTPRDVFPRLPFNAGVPMLVVTPSAVTAAPCSTTDPERGSVDSLSVSAITLAIPESAPTLPVRSAEHKQFPETLSGHVDSWYAHASSVGAISFQVQTFV